MKYHFDPHGEGWHCTRLMVDANGPGNLPRVRKAGKPRTATRDACVASDKELRSMSCGNMEKRSG
eukprot:5191757-Amphidinium_carterae.1